MLLFAFLFTACGGDKPCDEHIDEDGDAVCDTCDAEIEDGAGGGKEDGG